MELKGKKINFLGDSITYGFGVSDEKNIFYNRIKTEYGLAAARCFGIIGTRIAAQHGGEDFGEPFCTRYAGMDNDADAVVVFGGTNDYGHGNAEIGTFSDRGTDTFYGATHTLLKGLITKYPEAEIVVMTPLHRLGEDEPNPTTGKNLEEYVNIICELCSYYAIPVLDLYRSSLIQPAVPEIMDRLCPDGLHPNDEGHRIIASRLAGMLKML